MSVQISHRQNDLIKDGSANTVENMYETSNLQYLINHVFLPPKLPQKDDSSFENDISLLNACEEAIDRFIDHLQDSKRERLLVCQKIVQSMLKLREPSGDLSSKEIDEALEIMDDGNVLCYQLRAQNAGLIMRKRQNQVVFEIFELSATAEATMSTKGRLIRCFPGPAIAITSSKLANPHFRKAIAEFLAQLDKDTAGECLPIAHKANSKVSEVRESTHPKLVTELFAGMLRGIGEPADTVRIFKRTRDEALWDDTLKPWRRSPLWMLLRVTLQSTLMTDGKNKNGLYKSFMIFFMAHLTSRYSKGSFQSDILFIMTAKIGRRTLKLKVDHTVPEMQYVLSVVKAAHQKLACIWHGIEESKNMSGPLHDWQLSTHDFAIDTRLSLSNFLPYYRSIWNRVKTPGNRETLDISCRTRISQEPILPRIDTYPDSDEIELALMDIERWVRENLRIWLDQNHASPDSCNNLAELIQDYYNLAKEAYEGNPADLSVMFLTLMDLWIALDKCAIFQYPIIKDYNTGFPISLFDHLLLPQKVQMKRLQKVEDYLAQRKNTSNLAVRYFERSSHHQSLRQEIENIAADERAQKQMEFEQKDHEYDRLMRISNSSHCKCRRNKRGNLHFSSPYCSHCDHKKQANRININVAEWPLPSDELEAKSATFELDVPIVISRWRDTTYILLVDVFSPKSFQYSSDNHKLYHMKEYNGLKPYFRSSLARLQLTSSTKPFVVSHYGHRSFPEAKSNDICVSNGLRYSLYDSALCLWTANLTDRCDIHNKCTLKLPSTPLNSLQYALDSTNHTSNEIIAKQSTCPTGMNLHEQYSFAILRSGHRLQWRNILRELLSGSLNFSRQETYMLVVQTAWQAGCSNRKFWRESHEDLEEEQFGLSLTIALEKAISTVEGNWQGANAVRIFNVIASRLLSMSPFPAVLDRCHSFMKRARRISISWMRDVACLLQDEQEEGRIKELNLRLIELALTCHGTFDVDDDHVSSILRSEESMSILIECCITLHDRCPISIAALPVELRALLRRFKILSHSLEGRTRQQILVDRDGIDMAIKRLWNGYRKGGPWTVLTRPNDRWLKTISGAMIINYNVLDGSLLINGSPLGRLPRDYESHRTYSRLFGGKVLEVVPSVMEGMLFEIRNDFFGQRVHFQMYDDELIIRCQRGERFFELIPHNTLRGDFPNAFVEEYVHWLDLDTRTVEWRPLNDPWSSPSQAWKLIFLKGNLNLQKGDKKLVDVRSLTAELTSRILEPLENETYIHIFVDAITKELEVHLPRMNLNFFAEQPGSFIRSKEFRGMVIDERQAFGSLTGLSNKLVLWEANCKSRSVLVPNGDVHFEREGQHVQVKIITSFSSTYVNYNVYGIDDRLGRLVDNGSLHSRLFKLYLHAVTSHCLPDRLTGRTGTEEALMGLESGATNSFLDLSLSEQKILNLIARLTPRRYYYPKHLQVMQQARWLALSPLSQHCAFYQQVMRMLSQATRLRVFQENPPTFSQFDDCGDPFLNERAAIRNSFLYLHGFGAEAFTTRYDCPYTSRDKNINQERELDVCVISKLVVTSSMNLVLCPTLLNEIMSWGRTITGSGQSFSVGFDLIWLSSRSDVFSESFCSLLEYLQNCSIKKDKYHILILLSTLSYSSDARQGFVQALHLFATVPALRQIHIARQNAYTLSDGFEPARETLLAVTSAHVRPFSDCPESQLPKHANEDEDDAHERRLKEYQKSQRSNVHYFVEEVFAQWPCVDLRRPRRSVYGTYIAVDAAMKECCDYFQSWSRNSAFKKQIDRMQDILSNLISVQVLPQKYSLPSVSDEYFPPQAHLNFVDLTGQSAPPELPHFPRDEFDGWLTRTKTNDVDSQKLNALLDDMTSMASNKHEKGYMQDLQESSKALRQEKESKMCLPAGPKKILDDWMVNADKSLKDINRLISDSLKTGPHVILREAQMTPRMSPISILMYLASNKVGLICNDWKLALIHYAKAITVVQRAERLQAYLDSSEILNELRNSGHRNWDPLTYPDWLLMELENNILIREDQALIAQEMMYPSSKQNSVLQLNMGQGKSSVIVPAIAAVLANGVNVARVIVLKPLAKQMLQILIAKLGGMINRRVLYLPISRSLKLDASGAQQIRAVYEECQRTGSILLLQPEHLLSFELMGLEESLSDVSEVSRILISTQNWLDSHSRDILDESDEILSVRFELIYTIGLPGDIEFSPDRWTLIQHVLSLICEVAPVVQDLFPDEIEIKNARHGAFPQIRILQSSSGDKLLQLIAHKICKVGVRGLRLWHLSEEDRSSLFTYLMNFQCKPDMAKLIGSSGSNSTRSSLLLLKGLFRDILIFAFSQKRWRVNYGLDSSRSMLAVPFHAKDTPAPRSEFSHPDVTIVLTCLSYYYGGLTDEQIHACFTSLLLSDHAQETYEIWVKDAVNLPVHFRHITGINLKNEGQCAREVYPSLRFARNLINYYLSEIVFPKEMKEFPLKLSSSGWDIARTKANPTTGFSGTNDSRYVLPLSIKQRDLPEQHSTNASVLKCLLRSENYFTDIREYSENHALSAEILLNVAVNLKNPVRVILDVGAQIIEMRNEEVALSWLSRVPISEAQAAVFFDSKNELCVVTRCKRKEKLQISSFAKQLDQCLIYLDEAHTRGTDLKLPSQYRALVTLGPGLPKDRLVQACMRMRKLGKGQAVTFCCSKEVARSIRGLLKNREETKPIEVADILIWSIANTCTHTANMIPLWATQGIRHQNRLAEYAAVSDQISDHTVKSLLEPEAQPLEQRYNSAEESTDLLLKDTKEITFKYRRQQIEAIQEKCHDFQCQSRQSALLYEEQERELSPESERQQQVELPPPLLPLKHSVHKDLVGLVREGIFKRSSEAFRLAFETFRNTAARAWYEKAPWSDHLYVTNDFAQSVQAKPNHLVDGFLRPVHWVLVDRSGDDCVVISPYEANLLLPAIRQSNHVILYPYSPRQSISALLLPQTSQCMIPYASWLRWLKPQLGRQLDLFAGQLFFGSYSEYKSVCGFLGICSQPPKNGILVELDGFIGPRSRAKMTSAPIRDCRFKSSPIDFVKSIVSLRRKGLSYTTSHMGKLLNGELLSKEEFVVVAHEG